MRIHYILVLAGLLMLFPLFLRVHMQSQQTFATALRRDFTRRHAHHRLMWNRKKRSTGTPIGVDQDTESSRHGDEMEGRDHVHQEARPVVVNTQESESSPRHHVKAEQKRRNPYVSTPKQVKDGQEALLLDEKTGSHSAHKRTDEDGELGAVLQDEEPLLLETQPPLETPLLPPPRFMVVALHTKIQVFPRIMQQILPQMSKEWTVSFVVAQNPKKVEERDWAALFGSTEYKELVLAVHSINFSQLNTTKEKRNIANDFSYQHQWWNATSESIEYFWIVQDDAAVCSNNSKYCINDFLGWDYLGAPLEPVWWKGNWGSFGNQRPWTVPSYGNGGFSLRSRRLQVECTAPLYLKEHKRGDIPEDVYFSMCLRDTSMKFRVAPDDVARKFSSERPLRVGSFGWHLQSSIRSCNDAMIRYCPEALASYKRWGCGVPKDVKPLTQPPVVKCHFTQNNTLHQA